MAGLKKWHLSGWLVGWIGYRWVGWGLDHHPVLITTWELAGSVCLKSLDLIIDYITKKTYVTNLSRIKSVKNPDKLFTWFSFFLFHHQSDQLVHLGLGWVLIYEVIFHTWVIFSFNTTSLKATLKINRRQQKLCLYLIVCKWLSPNHVFCDTQLKKRINCIPFPIKFSMLSKKENLVDLQIWWAVLPGSQCPHFWLVGASGLSTPNISGFRLQANRL